MKNLYESLFHLFLDSAKDGCHPDVRLLLSCRHKPIAASAADVRSWSEMLPQSTTAKGKSGLCRSFRLLCTFVRYSAHGMLLCAARAAVVTQCRRTFFRASAQESLRRFCGRISGERLTRDRRCGLSPNPLPRGRLPLCLSLPLPWTDSRRWWWRRCCRWRRADADGFHPACRYKSATWGI